MVFSRFTQIFTALLGVALLCSCASVSVQKSEKLTSKAPRKLPVKVFIKPYAFAPDALRVDRSGEALEKFKFAFQERLSRHLVKRVSRYIAPAEAIAADAPLPKGNYWLITGQVNKVNQGSRIMRSIVGFGVGGTKMEATTLVYDLSVKPPRPFLVIDTTGGSNAAPGALGAAGFFIGDVSSLLALGNILEGVKSGVTFDTVRSSREITATLSEYLYQQKAISYADAIGPKRSGRWNPAWWPFQQRPQEAAQGTVTVQPAQ